MIKQTPPNSMKAHLRISSSFGRPCLVEPPYVSGDKGYFFYVRQGRRQNKLGRLYLPAKYLSTYGTYGFRRRYIHMYHSWCVVGVSEIDLIMMITVSQQSYFTNGTFQIRNLRKILVNLDVFRTFQTYRKVVSPIIAIYRQY